MKKLGILTVLVLLVGSGAFAASDCTFTVDGDTWRLDNNCTTDETIYVPNGVTLTGNNHIITAVDPPDGHFLGAVVANQGATAWITHLEIQASGLANVCDVGGDRLRGIMLESASGAITHCTVIGINQGASGCQEGNAIEIRNAPFDGTHPDTSDVTVEHNTILDWQKTGIVANGDVSATIRFNDVGASATQDNLAANSIQVAYGALGTVFNNAVGGNEWRGTSNWVATAILVYVAGEGLSVEGNRIRGNSDIGIYFYSDNGAIINNKVFDEGADHPNSGYDYGVGNWGTGNNANLNKIRGFDIPWDGVAGNHTVVIPRPHD